MEKIQFKNTQEKKEGIDFKKSTILLFKPDTLNNQNLQEDILKRLSYFVDIIKEKKIEKVDKKNIDNHYQDSKNKPYFPVVTSYIENKPCIAFLVKSKNVIERVFKNEKLLEKLKINPNDDFQTIFRKLIIGPSNPIKAENKHIRKLGILKYDINPDKSQEHKNLFPELWENLENVVCLDNLIHCSDSAESCEKEYNIWFKNN